MNQPYNITETGVRGFLKWMQVDNPGLYQKVAPELARQIPAAFSDFEASRRFQSRPALQGLGRLGDTTQSSPGLVDISFDPESVIPIAPVTATTVSDGSDVADAANAGSSTPSITNLITGIVGGISSLYMAKNQVDLQKQVTDIQLQRAQAGLPPLPINTSQLGVPQVAVGLATNTQSFIMWGGLAVLGAIVFSALAKGRR